MKTIARKEIGDFAVQIIQGKSWDGKTVYLVNKSIIKGTMLGKTSGSKRFFNKELAARYGRELVREMGR